MLKRTPLVESHRKLGGRLIEFGGWEMPVQYSGIIDEHLAVRNAAGLFDVSHMGKVSVTGSGAEAFLNQALTNDVRKLAPGQGQYTLMCNERGGVIDDLYAYKLAEEDYLLIINASRCDADWDWLQQHYDHSTVPGAIQLKNVSAQHGIIALQGPRAAECMKAALSGGSIGGVLVGTATDLKKNQAGIFLFNGVPITVARTGYTGEDGFEVVVPADTLTAVWDRFLEVGQPFRLQPAGLGARDTLRTEACFPLYGHELDEDTTPLEAGLGFFVSLEKDFVGRRALAEQKARGLTKKCVAFKMTDKSAPPRPHYAIGQPGGPKIGAVTSGTQSPSLGIGVGLGYVPVAHAAAGTALDIEIRGRPARAVVVPKPIYRKPA
ncbi:MAG: glycine cleavage system aminomethyltransferase GcvT [Verrucomicrobia bacterium]|nr:glycine cleavage system aminomethyltransferase GcvT [Verrucomicrobiota bacterium]